MDNTDTKTINNKPGFNKQPFRGKRDSGGRFPKATFQTPKPDFEQKIISIRRVTRVVAGGRRMTFAVAMAIGDKKGSIGLGTGKGGDTAIAINKSLRQAKKSMFKIKVDKNMTIPHEVSAKHTSSSVIIKPNKGKGLVAGSTVREMLILSGLKDITAKINSRSKNKLNNARATYKALLKLKDNQVVSKKLENEESSKTVEDKKD
ncbi:MAG TPA: 30S ribosomal protein S5 [Candidatus Paceibacterota bacterium]|nr:30S ribosomal protein S5 [Candidatus Paceibacterota bacterium]HPI82094.1 30S ribosomal protein S5 [Candidatus Paceibacterota bacterium]HPK13969.1 30S ribosomal protein S5 [Candidatus Paceibacterota bacterium]HPR83982.1 30S ribosomal protein S5 [Candidatus Paceibacterota bacterium]